MIVPIPVGNYVCPGILLAVSSDSRACPRLIHIDTVDRTGHLRISVFTLLRFGSVLRGGNDSKTAFANVFQDSHGACINPGNHLLRCVSFVAKPNSFLRYDD